MFMFFLTKQLLLQKRKQRDEKTTSRWSLSSEWLSLPSNFPLKIPNFLSVQTCDQNLMIFTALKDFNHQNVHDFSNNLLTFTEKKWKCRKNINSAVRLLPVGACRADGYRSPPISPEIPNFQSVRTCDENLKDFNRSERF